MLAAQPREPSFVYPTHLIPCPEAIVSGQCWGNVGGARKILNACRHVCLMPADLVRAPATGSLNNDGKLGKQLAVWWPFVGGGGVKIRGRSLERRGDLSPVPGQRAAAPPWRMSLYLVEMPRGGIYESSRGKGWVRGCDDIKGSVRGTDANGQHGATTSRNKGTKRTTSLAGRRIL